MVTIGECEPEVAAQWRGERQERRLFQESWWMEAVAEGRGLALGMLRAERDGEVLAYLPYWVHTRGPLRRMGSPLRGTFTAFTGFLEPSVLSGVDRGRIGTAVLRHWRARGANWVELGFEREEEAVSEALVAAGCEVDRPSTFVLDVPGGEEEAWEVLTGRARNMVRKARKCGVEIRRLEGTAAEVAAFYEVLGATFAKSGRTPPHSQRFYEVLVSRLVPGGRMLFLAAECDGETVAYGMFPFNPREIHYLSGASLPAANKVAANSLIQWEAIRAAAERGIVHYDFGGSGIASIDKFKMSFGGRPASYCRYVWMGTWVGLAYRGYMRWRPVLDRFIKP
ncbi:lipid II:glycine glycyltransferase FemX [Endothiovibrio diazotrophicus]